MKILVTGSNGFLGRHVVQNLVDHGHQVNAMIQPGTSDDCFPQQGVSVTPADLTDPDSLTRAIAGCDAVVHLAALVQEWGRYEWFKKSNVEGTRNLADAASAAGARKFLFISSLAVHGRGDFVDGTEAAPRHHDGNPYARSKIEAEDLLRAYEQEGKLDVTIVRPGMIPYGEWDLRGFPPLAATIRRSLMPVTGNPNHLTCAVYAPNFAHGIRLALENPQFGGQSFVFTDGEKLSWADYFHAIARAIDRPLRLLKIPNWPVVAAAAAAERLWLHRGPGTRPPITRYLARLMTRDTHFGSTHASDLLGYQPRFSFEEGMARTCRWWGEAN